MDRHRHRRADRVAVPLHLAGIAAVSLDPRPRRFDARFLVVDAAFIAELFPTVLRGTGFGIAVGGGRVVSIAAPTVIGWAIMRYGLQTPYLALAGLWVLTLVGYLLGPETKGKELEDLTDEALTEDLVSVQN